MSSSSPAPPSPAAAQDPASSSSSSLSHPPPPSYIQQFYHQMETAPCFRVPLMWGIACGIAAGLHKWRIHRASPQAIMNACDFAVLGMGVSTSLGWWMCMRQKKQEEAELQRVMAMQGFKPMAELPKEGEEKKKW